MSMRKPAAPLSGLSRKEAVSMEELVRRYIDEMKLGPGLNRQCVYRAWDTVTGMGPYTLRKYFRDGVLYCTLSSSVVRSQLHEQRSLVIRRINASLAQDPFFTGADAAGYVRSLVLK